MLTTDEERIHVMSLVKSGDMSVDEALLAVGKTEKQRRSTTVLSRKPVKRGTTTTAVGWGTDSDTEPGMVTDAGHSGRPNASMASAHGLHRGGVSARARVCV